MMTSKTDYTRAYVWIWLPRASEPVVAGVLNYQADGRLFFNYGRSYLEREDAISIYEPELPLKAGAIEPLERMQMPSAIRDGSPDAWGRRVIINRMTGLRGAEADARELNELTYLLESGSDRIGALDFQTSPNEYVARQKQNASLDELMQSAQRVEDGVPLSPDLDRALQHRTALGGARPKALIDDGNTKYIAKFSASSDLYNVVKGEFVAMRLAQRAGLNVANVALTQGLGKDVLLIKRFDRTYSNGRWTRHGIVSGLTLLGLDETEARYASYEELATMIRHRFADPQATLQELFGRMVFNILSGNTDDHARNHAAFWDGQTLHLTPAYDICPQGRTGGEASQAMRIKGENNMSQLTTCLAAAGDYQLNEAQARAIIDAQIELIETQWAQVCDEAAMTTVERGFLMGRQFLNPYALQGYQDGA